MPTQSYRQLISCQYHDDGEKELGPTVATLSLGSPSIMSFRPKKLNEVWPENLKSTEMKQKAHAREARCECGGNTANCRKKCRRKRPHKLPVIRFALNHGDMVVMHGTQIHRLYEV